MEYRFANVKYDEGWSDGGGDPYAYINNSMLPKTMRVRTAAYSQ